MATQVKTVHEESKGRYGAPRVHAQLRNEGRRHSRKRVARLMRAQGLRGRAARRWKKTTIPDPAAAARADRIWRDFTADASSINTRWCGDITYIATWEGWLYLATVIDIASRRVVGHAMFLDIGTGIPTGGNTHEVAQAVAPDSRIVYVDNDPIVLAHARALMTSEPVGATAFIQADFREPDKILAGPALRRTLDLDKPVALMLVAILHFFTDDEDPQGIVSSLIDALRRAATSPSRISLRTSWTRSKRPRPRRRDSRGASHTCRAARRRSLRSSPAST
jgi:hypothetical protein